MGSQPSLFHYSLDWRFLVPLADTKKIYLLLKEDQNFSQAIQQVGIPTSQLLSVGELQQKMGDDIQCLVMPFGMPAREVTARSKDQLEFYSSIHRLVSSGGCFLVGFNNAWNLRAHSHETYYPSTPPRIIKQLKQAGFKSIEVFGAVPNLAIPEYIFNLEARTIQFALRNRFRRKPALLSVLQVLSVTMGWKRLSNFLPCYFAVATA